MMATTLSIRYATFLSMNGNFGEVTDVIDHAIEHNATNSELCLS